MKISFIKSVHFKIVRNIIFPLQVVEGRENAQKKEESLFLHFLFVLINFLFGTRVFIKNGKNCSL